MSQWPDVGESSTAPRVLIVDDDGATADSFSRTLRLEGYEVWAALSAEEGLSLAQTHQPHAIVLDLRMPLTSGCSSCARSARFPAWPLPRRHRHR